MPVKNALKFGLTNRATETETKTKPDTLTKKSGNNMKLTKSILCTAMAGTMLFAASKAPAVLGPVTISAKATYQDFDKNGNPKASNHSINQKLVLQILAIATGDGSITNNKTTLLYDPDQYNYTAYFSNEGYDFYGEFYYSNSVAGLTALDGTDFFGDYYSYIELDSYVDYDYPPVDYMLGFANPNYTAFNAIAKGKDTPNSSKVSLAGNAVLYLHSYPYDYNLPHNMYYANGYFGYDQQYALAIRGPITFNWSANPKQENESFSLQGTGDGIYYDSNNGYIDLVLNGKAKFKARAK